MTPDARDWSGVAFLLALTVFIVLAAYALAYDPHPVIHPDCQTEGC